jgi:ElaB/YqjD/DUF883 family membrane-anchored ribosome-binding protein
MRTKYTIDDIRDALGRTGLIDNEIVSRPFGYFAIGCAVGLVLGAGVAMLVAPSSGREVRAKISGKAKELSERAKSSVKEAKSNVESAVEGMRSTQQQYPSESFGQNVIR